MPRFYHPDLPPPEAIPPAAIPPAAIPPEVIPPAASVAPANTASATSASSSEVANAVHAPWREIVTAFTVDLEAEEARHAALVLRLRVGAEVELFDGRGLACRGVLVNVDRKRTSVRLTHWRRSPALTPTLHLAVAPPKGGRLDDLVNQLVQLGVARLTPLLTARSVVHPRETKLERLTKVVVEATKQCGRDELMQLAAPSTLNDWLTQPMADGALRLLADPAGAAELPTSVQSAQQICVLIGPEGGWDDSELAAAREAGYTPWRLAPHVLRIETAAAAAAAILRWRTQP